MQLQDSAGYGVIDQWLVSKGFKAFPYQEEAWQHIINGKSGLVNAPTGTGKTFSVFSGASYNSLTTTPALIKRNQKMVCN